jgi:hypothetical protein
MSRPGEPNLVVGVWKLWSVYGISRPPWLRGVRAARRAEFCVAHSGQVAGSSASVLAQSRPATARRSPDRNQSHEVGSDEAVVDVMPRSRHQHAPVLATRHRQVRASELRSRSYPVEHNSKLFVEEEASCRTVLPPPTCATLGFSYEARRELELHGMDRSLAQSSSSLTA